DHRTAVHASGVERREEVAVVLVERVVLLPARSLGAAVAAQVHGDDAEVLRQVGHRRLQHLSVRDLEDRREGDPRPALAVHRIPALHALALDEAVAHGTQRAEGKLLARRQPSGLGKLAHHPVEGLGEAIHHALLFRRSALRTRASIVSSSASTASSAARFAASSFFSPRRSANSMPIQNCEIQVAITSALKGGGSFIPSASSVASASRTASETIFFHARTRGMNFSRSPASDRLAAHSSACTRTNPDARSLL